MSGGHVLGLLAILLLVPCSHGETVSGSVGDSSAVATASGPTETFSVRPRRDDLYFYPCADCHEFSLEEEEHRGIQAW